MKRIRMGQAARLFKLTPQQLVDRQYGDYIVIEGHRMRVYQERPGANRFLDDREVRRVLARLAQRQPG